MKGISRRARACAVATVTGVAVLAGAGTAHAQRSTTVGDGAPTGQGSVQLFNYGGFISTGSGVTGGSQPASIPSTKTLAELGITIAPATDGTQCATSTTGGTTPDPAARLLDCRWNRLEALFSFLAKKGVTNIELFGHAALPADTDIAGLTRYRTLVDKYKLHVAGWHGSVTESTWDAHITAVKILGADSTGNGGFPNPGVTSGLDNLYRTVETLNRLGKRSVEAGAGQVYFHNHQQEFRTRYIENGVRKTAWQIVMERMDPRYVYAEVDAGWASDAYDDPTGTVVAGLINQFPNSIKALHVKDVLNVAPATPPASGDPLDSTGNASPTAFGTGQINYAPIFSAARNRVSYYHMEQDGGSLNNSDIGLSNLKGVGTAVTGTVLALPTTFPSAAANAPAASNVVPVTITNSGDAPLTITALALATGNNARADELPGDFQIVSNTCVGTPLPAATAPTAQNPGGTRSSCVVNVNFRPTATNRTSVTRLLVTSNADNGSESVYLVGNSTGDALGGVGGDVASMLSLTVNQAASFGSFAPATARNYDAAAAATVISTAGDAKLSVTDPSAVATGRLVNTNGGTFSLPQLLQVRANNAGNTGTTYSSLSSTAGTPVDLLTYTGPTAGADNVTLNFRQAIGATDPLRSGSYSKTLTFTLSTTTP